MRRISSSLAMLSVVVLCSGNAWGAVRHVPMDHATIQAAVTASFSGDTILVAPGSHSGCIDFGGKTLVVTSSGGADVTRLTACNPMIWIRPGAGPGTELSGFRFDSISASELIVVYGGATALIRNNLFRWNSFGEGITCVQANCTIERNLFVNNVTSSGACVGVSNDAGTSITNNTFDGNGRGIYIIEPSVATAVTIVRNNVISRSTDYGVFSEPGLSELVYNDLWSNNPDYANAASAGTGSTSADPEYVDPSQFDFRLSGISPCINAGHPDDAFNDPDGSRNDMGAFPFACVDTSGSGDCDSDGIANSVDNCLLITNALQEDADSDDVGDACDNCPSEMNPGQSDFDADDEGDACDNCPMSSNAGQEDGDVDGRGNVCDNCPEDFNPAQADSDGDGIGDVCDNCILDSLNDVDGDGVCGSSDNCPTIANAGQNDTDFDGLGNPCDNCPSKFNPTQEETDGDGIADSCDNCPTVFNTSQQDADNDGVGNVCDPCILDPLNDPDLDGVCNSTDNCPGVANPSQADTNSNNVGDACECACQCHGDPACDSVIANIVDVVGTVNVAFRGASTITDPSSTCPWQSTDTNCSGTTDVIDVVKVVNVAFRGANPMTEYCEACP